MTPQELKQGINAFDQSKDEVGRALGKASGASILDKYLRGARSVDPTLALLLRQALHHEGVRRDLGLTLKRTTKHQKGNTDDRQ